jgi:hypothetical protein
MTDFTNLAVLVAQGQALLDLVKGGHITQLEADNAAKLGEVDTALALKIAQANTAIANATKPVDSKIPHLQLSANQELKITSGSVPDDMWVSKGVTIEVLENISRQGSGRTAGAYQLLIEMQNDIQEQFADFSIRDGISYVLEFNVIRLSWDFTGDFTGFNSLLKLNTAKNVPTFFQVADQTVASFLKLESGGVIGALTDGCELAKWRYCSTLDHKHWEGHFGAYKEFYIAAETQTGSLLLALPAVITGSIGHPSNLFKNIEV